jgi:hypothetical protein
MGIFDARSRLLAAASPSWLKVSRRRADFDRGSSRMNLIARNRLLLLLALAHFLMDAGFAGGAVLCVGTGDHRAVESAVAASLGCPATASGDALPHEAGAFSTADRLSDKCVDRPLHSDAELVSSQPESADSPPIVGIVAPVVPPATRRISTIRPGARAPDETAASRAVRTTVLIL